MATSIDGGVTSASALAANNSPHLFTMSNGDIVAVYFNGTNWGYRVKHGGTWGSFTSLATLPGAGTDMSGAGCRNGDTVFFASGHNAANFRCAKMVYNTGTGTFTVTYSSATGDNAGVYGAYYDATNNYVHVLVRLADVGLYSVGYNAATISQTKIAAKAVTGAPTDSGGNQKAATYATVGDGTSTFYCVMFDTTGATTAKVTKLVAGTTNYTQTAETGVTALAANCKGADAIYDGTNIVIFANENNAKLRTMTRTAANTYTAWSDIDVATLAGAPSVGLKASTGDLVVVWQRTAGQPSGEIYRASRVGGTWSAATLLNGGAATGWSTPNASLDDTNESAGLIRILYLQGTANPYTLVEDSTTITAGGGGGVLQILSGRIASALAVRGGTAAGVLATLLSSRIVSNVALRGGTISGLLAQLTSGRIGAATIVRGGTIGGLLARLSSGRVASSATIRGGSLRGLGASLLSGRVASAAALRGGALNGVLATFNSGRIAAASAVRGGALAGVLAQLASGRIATAAAVRGGLLTAGSQLIIRSGRIVSSAAARGGQIVGVGVGRLASGRVASGAAARGGTLRGVLAAIRSGRVAAATVVRGGIVRGLIARLASGRIASTAITRGPQTITGAGAARLTSGRVATVARVRGGAIAGFGAALLESGRALTAALVRGGLLLIRRSGGITVGPLTSKTYLSVTVETTNVLTASTTATEHLTATDRAAT